MVRAPRKRSASRPDPYAEVTERITAALERGAVPWRHPWRARGLRNALSNRPYRGINVLLLAIAALERGYDDPRWLTYRQGEQAGGHVRRGEHGVRIVLWRWIEREDGAAEEPVERFPLMRWFTVFNVAQCDGLSLPEADTTATFEPIERAEAIVAGYTGGPAVLHDAEAAYYAPSRDEVHLPPRDAFGSTDGYYATLFHELAHSTGHPSRLRREGYLEAAVFGSPVYSREELVAEFGAAFLCVEAGIDASRLEQSAAYIQSWLRALNDDRRLVVVAAGQGQRAADRILGVRFEDVEEPDSAADRDPGPLDSTEQSQ